MKRVRALTLAVLAAAFWLGGAVAFWSQLPVSGPVLVRSDNSLYVLGFDRSGALAVARLRVLASGATPVGPLTFHDARTGAVTGSCVPRGARILTRTLINDFVVAQTDHEIQLISVVDGRTIVRHPFNDGGRNRTDISPSGDRFLVVADRTLAVYDTQSGDRLWTRNDAGKSRFLGDDALVARVKRSSEELTQSTYPGKDVRFDAHTGAPLEMVHQPYYDCGAGRLSPNGAYTLTHGSQGNDRPPGLYDNATGELQWEVDPQLMRFVTPFGSALCFSADSEEVQGTYRIGERSLGTARWRVRDGRAIAPIPDTATFRFEDFHPYFGSADGRWSLIGFTSRSLWFQIPRPIFAQIAAWWPKPFNPPEWSQVFAIVDNARDGVIGTMPKSWDQPRLTPDGTGIIAPDEHEIRRYELAPDRRFAWLFGWGVAPATFIVALGVRRSRAARIASAGRVKIQTGSAAA